MDSLDKVFTEEQVNEVSQKILKSTISKITDEISNKFYHELDNYIYDHYTNTKSRVEKSLIEEITEQFILDPNNSKYYNLRKKLFSENKDLLIKTLSDESIYESVENVIEKYTHRDYTFNWRWKEAILRIIAENWHLFKDDERIHSQLLRENQSLKDQIARMREKIESISNL